DGTKASLPRSPLAPNGTRLAPVELVALIGVMLLLVKITAALVSLLNPSPHCVIVAGFQNMDERLGPPAAAPAIEGPCKCALCSWREKPPACAALEPSAMAPSAVPVSIAAFMRRRAAIAPSSTARQSRVLAPISCQRPADRQSRIGAMRPSRVQNSARRCIVATEVCTAK